MLLARILSKIYNEGGIILVDCNNIKYICGSPKKNNPTKIKLLKKNLNWKLILDPEFEFAKGYMLSLIHI